MTQIDPLPPPADDQLADLRRDNPDSTPVLSVTLPFRAIGKAWRWLWR
jgi:hypothetical protein